MIFLVLALALVGARLAREGVFTDAESFAGKPRSYKIKTKTKTKTKIKIEGKAQVIVSRPA
ncbi:hypothetical protein [Pseudomonas nunensis]|uniref:hypothetical protein n=1 Tax=Pseudomonas nunensis TaxID=2961896 RepID=UPI0025B11CB9|nr:hypothetical protein [Pseudomonas nunensis]MDN3220285.1 hypothetical protein [Pseudomonas nunensis]